MSVVSPPLPAAPARRGRPPRRIGSTVVLVVAAVYFLVPLVAMARFAFQRVPVARLGWGTLLEGWSLRSLDTAFSDPGFGPALWASARLAVGAIVLTLGLLLPTAVWVHLRVPRARPFVEFLTILPYVVPPIALVVGVADAFRDTVPSFLASDWFLVPFYAVLAMPFTYRSLDAGIRAIDLRTLVDASRSLGAGWGTTIRRVLVPNLRAAIVGSSFLTATVVLGEFTIASLLLKDTFPVYMAQYQARQPQGGMALALVSLVATTLLLGALTALTRRRGAAAGPVAPVV